jgi:hypothetical protein
MRTENVLPGCCGKQQYGCLETKFSVTGRKDVYHEVEEFICNSCRFDHKDPADWVKDQESSIKTQLSTKIIILEN